MLKWISKILYAILGFIVGIFFVPFIFVLFTMLLLFVCLVLPFYMAYEGMSLE